MTDSRNQSCLFRTETRSGVFSLAVQVVKDFKDNQMEDQAYKSDDLWPISENSDSIYHTELSRLFIGMLVS